jgi:hypothetical protein
LKSRCQAKPTGMREKKINQSIITERQYIPLIQQEALSKICSNDVASVWNSKHPIMTKILPLNFVACSMCLRAHSKSRILFMFPSYLLFCHRSGYCLSTRHRPAILSHDADPNIIHHDMNVCSAANPVPAGRVTIHHHAIRFGLLR